jgi:hypothetical protein
MQISSTFRAKSEGDSTSSQLIHLAYHPSPFLLSLTNIHTHTNTYSHAEGLLRLRYVHPLQC